MAVSETTPHVHGNVGQLQVLHQKFSIVTQYWLASKGSRKGGREGGREGEIEERGERKKEVGERRELKSSKLHHCPQIQGAPC